MKTLIFLATLATSTLAHAEAVYINTTIDCATTNGRFQGTKAYPQEKNQFTEEELKNILLGDRQTESAPLPYPQDRVVAPRVLGIQEIALPVTGPFSPNKALYWTLGSENFLPMPVFCTVSVVRSL